MPTPNIQTLHIFQKNRFPNYLHLSLSKFLFAYLWIAGFTTSLQAQDTSKTPKDTIHKHKITQVYCKITTTHGNLENETFHIYFKEKVVYELTITDHITEYYFPISIESWTPLEELYVYLDDDHKHYYHFKKRRRKDDVYEYDLVIDLRKIKKRENRHKKHGH